MAEILTNWQVEMTALAHKAIEQLSGTCKAIYELGEEFEAASNNTTFCAVIDENIFCCTSCNWWFEQSEMANRKDEEWICEECTDDDERK